MNEITCFWILFTITVYIGVDVDGIIDPRPTEKCVDKETMKAVLDKIKDSHVITEKVANFEESSVRFLSGTREVFPGNFCEFIFSVDANIIGPEVIRASLAKHKAKYFCKVAVAHQRHEGNKYSFLGPIQCIKLMISKFMN